MKMLKTLLFGGAGAVTRFGDLGLTLVRVLAGVWMAYGHGYSKMFHAGGVGPDKGFIAGIETMNFPAPTLFAWMAVLTEFLGGLLLAAGLMTRPAAFLLVCNMLVAAFIAHRGAPNFGPAEGNRELALLYLFLFTGFVFVGGGRYAIDALLRRKSIKGAT